MSTAPFANWDDEALGQLNEANRSLDRGDLTDARALAQHILAKARANGDRRVEARALSCLAHCDRVASRLRRSSDAGRRAAQLFQLLEDVEGEANALTTLAHVSTFLGRNEEAIEAALLSVRLCEHLADARHMALAQNYLGVAYGWAGRFELADEALEASARAAERSAPRLSPYQPRTNQCWFEAIRLVNERYRTGEHPSAARLAALMESCHQLEDVGMTAPIISGLRVVEVALAALLSGLVRCWTGDTTGALTSLAAARMWLEKYDTETWVTCFGFWVEAEIAWVQGDWELTESSLARMTEASIKVEHEQLACMGHLLTCQVYKIQGKHELATQELHMLRQRELRIRMESLRCREEAVTWQLDARQSQKRLEHLHVISEQFERWALEDALTGIANRRCFEKRLSEQLKLWRASGVPLSVALIDVDKFKSVNDRFSHQVGDRVLKTLATLLSTHVRERDLAARLAGDEFVVLFVQADATVAQGVCERISSAVAAFDWTAIVDGLQVGISVGLAQAVEGDTAASLLHRSDEAMYEAKPSPIADATAVR